MSKESIIRIFLVRHAQSEWQINPSENMNTPLTAMGHLQAQFLAQWLASYPELGDGSHAKVMNLYTSPLKRAKETADYLATALQLPLTVKDCLQEANFHVASQLPQQDNPIPPFSTVKLSEDYVNFKAQVDTAFKYLVYQAQTSNGPVLAVTHGGFIKTFLRHTIGSDMVCFNLYNSCINLIEWKRKRWHLVFLNLWDHLSTQYRTK